MRYEELIVVIREAANKLGDELEKTFPGLKSLKYSTDSLASCSGDDFVNRMIFGIYLELVRADLLNDIKAE
jgi:hypothetical protein